MADVAAPNRRQLRGDQNPGQVVYFCSEGRPWESNGHGGYQRISIEEANKQLIAGAKRLPKPYDSEVGF